MYLFLHADYEGSVTPKLTFSEELLRLCRCLKAGEIHASCGITDSEPSFMLCVVFSSGYCQKETRSEFPEVLYK